MGLLRIRPTVIVDFTAYAVFVCGACLGRTQPDKVALYVVFNIAIFICDFERAVVMHSIKFPREPPLATAIQRLYLRALAKSAIARPAMLSAGSSHS